MLAQGPISLITDQAAYDAFIGQGADLSGYNQYTALPGERTLQGAEPGSFFKIGAAERVARRAMREELARAAGLTIDQAAQAEADYRHLGEYTDDYKALMRAYKNTDHYRQAASRDEDGALGDGTFIFNEKYWTRRPTGQNAFSNFLTGALYAGAGALMGGVGAAGAAGGSGGGAAGFAVPTATEIGLAAGAGNSALLAGTSAGSLAGAGAAAGGAVGAAANGGSTGNYFNMPGQTEMGLYSGAGDSALLGGTSSGGLGGVGAAGAVAGAGGSSGGASGAAGNGLGGLMEGMTMKDWLGIGATVVGALGSDSPDSQTMTSTNAPPAWLLPYLQHGAGQANALYNQGPLQYYPGQAVAPFSQESLAAMDMISNRAMAGSPVTAGANDLATKTLQGDFLYGGPGFDQAYQSTMNRVTPMIDSKFAASGRYGSGLHKAALGQAASDSLAGLYNNERSRQTQALALSPTLANADYNDAQYLSQVGGNREQLAQDMINADMTRYNYNQNAPWQNLSNLMSVLQGRNFGGTTTQTTPLYRNRAAGLLGGAIAGSDLANDVGWNPTTGAIMGGILGGWM